MIRTLSLVLLTSLALMRVALAQAELSPAKVAEMRAEQDAPRQPVPFDPLNFDKFVGAYHFMPDSVMWITRDGYHYFERVTGQAAVEEFPESPTKFFSNDARHQLSFQSDASGKVTGLVLHQAGMERPMTRISAEDAKAIEDALTARTKANTPSPDTEAALRHQIAAVEKGAFDTAAMWPPLAALVRSQAPVAVHTFAALGALKSVTFKNVGPDGYDLYEVEFEHGQLDWRIWPLADGKIKAMRYMTVQP
jgi:hypothetical protein